MSIILHVIYVRFAAVEVYLLCLPFFFQNLAVARSFPPSPESGAAPEDEDTENLAGDESDDEATEEDVDEGDNANEFIVDQRMHNVETLSDTESSPEADHGLNADDPPVIDAVPLTATPAAQKRSAGGFADEESLFDE